MNRKSNPWVALVALILLLVLVVCTCTGCAERDEEGNAVYSLCEGVSFVKVADAMAIEIWVHEETKVMYVARWGGSGIGLSVMVDANGVPMIWEGEV